MFKQIRSVNDYVETHKQQHPPARRSREYRRESGMATPETAVAPERGKSGLPMETGAVIYGTIGIIGVAVGTTIASSVYFGSVMLAGAVAVIETQPRIKRIVVKNNRLIDVIILGSSIYAMITLGVLITGALTFAGLGYTLVYSPWLKRGDTV